MKQYEYEVIRKHIEPGATGDITHWLNKMGQQGWVNYHIKDEPHYKSAVYYFRRVVEGSLSS